MAPVRSHAELRGVLSRWDKSSRSQRQQFLKEFIQNAKNMTGPELEKEFGNGASLFLTRICAYLRTVNMTGGPVGLALQAISVFVGSASGHRFLVEFIEGGGLPVVAEILSKDGASEADRIKALQLLSNIASAGHTYKQMIGELDGIKAICDFIRLAKTDAAHELSRGLLVSLGRSSKRSEALHMYLVELLMIDEPQVQRTAAQVLRQLLAPSAVEGAAAATPDPRLVEAVCHMLSTTQVHVRYEAKELGLFAMGHPATSKHMTRSVVDMLVPEPYTYNNRPTRTPSDGDLFGHAASAAANAYLEDQPVPVCLLRQSAGARLIASYVNEGPRGSGELEGVIDLMMQESADVVSSLLVCCANRDYDDSAKAGVLALSGLIKKSHAADQRLLALTGPTFHQAWHADSSSCARALDVESLNELFVATGNEHLRYHNTAEGNAPWGEPVDGEGEGIEEGEEGEDGEEGGEGEDGEDGEDGEFDDDGVAEEGQEGGGGDIDFAGGPQVEEGGEGGDSEGGEAGQVGGEYAEFPEPQPGEGTEAGGAREEEADVDDEAEGDQGGVEESQGGGAGDGGDHGDHGAQRTAVEDEK